MTKIVIALIVVAALATGADRAAAQGQAWCLNPRERRGNVVDTTRSSNAWRRERAGPVTAHQTRITRRTGPMQAGRRALNGAASGSPPDLAPPTTP